MKTDFINNMTHELKDTDFNNIAGRTNALGSFDKEITLLPATSF